MKVKYIKEGDIIITPVNIKKRRCVVVKIIEKTAIVVPLTSQDEDSSNIPIAEAPELLNSRFLSKPSYFCFSLIHVPILDAQENMVGYVSEETLKLITKTVYNYNYTEEN